MKRVLMTAMVALFLGLSGTAAASTNLTSEVLIQSPEQGQAKPLPQWYSWGYYPTQPQCLSAGAVYQAEPQFISYRCLKVTIGTNAGKWQLWLQEIS